jgi:hypothetical protein
VAYGAQVHHLIEKCICYNMDREECMETLQKHANIKPVITSTGTCTSYLLRCCFDYCRNSASVYNFLPFSIFTPLAVWKELEKENREFFEAYKKDRGEESSQKNPPDQPAAAKSSDYDGDDDDDD